MIKVKYVDTGGEIGADVGANEGADVGAVIR